MQNPFNINFGKEPFSIISRENELHEIYESFSSDYPFSNVFILTGIRGSGKTVAMTNVSNFYKKEDNWIYVELNPENDLLEQLASKIYDEGKIKRLFISTEFNFSFKGIGMTIKGKEPISNVSSLLKREFEYLSKKNIKVLIGIDEVVSNTYMKVFCHEFQALLRQDFFVCLIMTGLYQNISSLENQKSLTFLYRAPKIYIDSLNPRAIANSYKNIFNIDEDKCIELAKFTRGYAFAYQLLGSILYNENKKELDDLVIQKFDELIQERAYQIIYSELNKKEKEIIQLATIDNSNAFIIQKSNISKSLLSDYKKKLYLKGIIKNDHNSIIFKLPRFKEFLVFNNEYNN